jgi:hypothetical protein
LQPTIPQLEGYAAYSPIKHLLVTAKGATTLTGSAKGEGRIIKGTQGDLGLGLYTTFWKGHWYVGILGGHGLAQSFNRKSEPNTPLKEYRARYNYTYGQLYLALQNKDAALGVCWRLSKLDYNSLTFNGQPVQEPVADLYSDFSVFLRFIVIKNGALQAQLQVGPSGPLLKPFKGKDTDLSSTATLAGLSLIVRPHMLGKGAERAK